jgi:hypothetical protein
MKAPHIKILSVTCGFAAAAFAPAAHSQVQIVTDHFNSIGNQWSPSRYPSAIFQSVSNPYADANNASVNVLQIGVAASDYQANHFLDYQGYGQNITLGLGTYNSVQTQLHLDSSWSTTARIRTGLWLASATDPTWTAIIGFSNLNGNNATLEYFDNNLSGGGDWVSLSSVTLDYGTWTTLGMAVTGGNIDFFVNGTQVAEISNGGNTTFNSLAIVNENGLSGDPQGVTYSAYYDNLLVPQTVPEPASISMFALGGAVLFAWGKSRSRN